MIPSMRLLTFMMSTLYDALTTSGWLNSAINQNSNANFRYEPFVPLPYSSHAKLTVIPQMFELIAFSFSIMGVVASVTSTFSFPLVSGGHVGMVFGWLIPCLFVMTVAASMAELASSMP